MRNHLLAGVMGLALIAACYEPANADVYIGLQEASVNGGALTTVATGPDLATFAGAYGTWFNLQAIVGTDIGAKNATTSLNVLGTAARDLIIDVTTTNQTGADPLVSSFTTNALDAPNTIQLSSYVDPGNGIYAKTQQIGDHLFDTIGTDIDPGPVAPDGLYSVTIEYAIHWLGHSLDALESTTDVRAAPSPVPEPGEFGLALLGMGLLGFCAARRRNLI